MGGRGGGRGRQQRRGRPGARRRRRGDRARPAAAAAAVTVLGAARGARVGVRLRGGTAAAAPLAAAAAAAAAGLFGADAAAAAGGSRPPRRHARRRRRPRAARRAAAAALGGAAAVELSRGPRTRLAAALGRRDAAVRATAPRPGGPGHRADGARRRGRGPAGALLDPAAAVRRAAVVALARLVGRDYLKPGRPCHRQRAAPPTPTRPVAAAAARARRSSATTRARRAHRRAGGGAERRRRRAAARYGDAERRGPVYAAALALSPERRGEATARLAKDVLGPAADAPDAALAKMDGRLADALRILRADLRLRKGARAKDRADDDADDPAAAALDKARGRLLGRASKKHLLEQVLPTLLALRHRLRALRLGVAADVEATLAERRAHGAAVDAVLANDPMLARELRA